MTDDLRFGLGARYIYSNLASGQLADGREIRPGTALALDLGLHYERRLGDEIFAVKQLAAWSLTNMGGAISYTDEPAEDGWSNKDPLPTMMRTGLGVDVELARIWLDRPFMRLGLYSAASKMIVARDTSHVHNSFGALFFETWKPITVDLNRTDDEPGVRLSVWDQLMWHGGLEISLFDILFVRRGHFEEHAYNGNRAYETMGWGIDLFFVAYETSSLDNEERHHPLAGTRISTLTVRVPLGGEAEGNFWTELIRLVRR